MLRLKSILFFAVLAVSTISFGTDNAAYLFESKVSKLATADTEQKIQVLLEQMTLKEKAGQMLNIGLPAVLTKGYWDSSDTAVFDAARFRKYIVDYGVGSIPNTPGIPPDKDTWYGIIKEIQDAAMQETRLGIPVLYGIDNQWISEEDDFEVFVGGNPSKMLTQGFYLSR